MGGGFRLVWASLSVQLLCKRRSVLASSFSKDVCKVWGSLVVIALLLGSCS